MHIRAFRSAGDEQIGRGKNFDQDRFVAALDPVHKSLDAKNVVEIEWELIVAIGQRHKARKPARLAPHLESAKSFRAALDSEGAQFVPAGAPLSASEHQFSGRELRKIRR